MIDILIPNYNGKHLLKNCLDSILPQMEQDDLITVIDNGSGDGSIAFLQQQYPLVNIVEHSTNRGFSAAINAGVIATDNSYIFLLNNDTELEGNCLDHLRNAVMDNQEYSFFALKMLSYTERDLLDGAGDGYLCGGAGYRLGTMEKDGTVYNVQKRVFGACAGAALYRRSFFDKVGLLDEDFFAYLEDVDINLRANRMGMRCLYLPGARVYHIGSATTGSTFNPLTIKLSTRNSLNVIVKNYSGKVFLSLFIQIVIYQFFWFVFTVKKKQFLSYLAGIASFLRHSLGTFKKRSSGRQLAVLSDHEFRKTLLTAELEVVSSIMHRRESAGKSNYLLRLYQQIFFSSSSCDG